MHLHVRKLSLLNILVCLLIIFACTKPSSINLINMCNTRQITFNPERQVIGFGLIINGRGLELNECLLKQLDTLQIYLQTKDSTLLLWAIGAKKRISVAAIEYGKTNRFYNQIYPSNNGLPQPILDRDIIRARFVYKKRCDTLTAVFDKCASSITFKKL